MLLRVIHPATWLLLLVLPLASAWSVEERLPPAAIRLHGQVITVLRAPLFGYTPAERAARSVIRITEVLENSGSITEVVSSRIVDDGVLISIYQQDVLLMVPADADRLLGQTLDQAASAAAAALTAIIKEEHSPQSVERQLASWLKVVVASLIYAGVVVVLVLVRGWVTRLIVRLAQACAGAVQHRELAAFLQDQLVRSLRWAVLILAWAFGLLGGYVWVSVCLQAFLTTRDVGEQLGGRLLRVTLELIVTIGQSIPQLAIIACIMILTGVVVHVITLFFARIERRNVNLGWLNRHTAAPTRRITTVVMWLAALAIAYPYVPGSSSDSFRGISLLVGVMASLGGASLVGQAASGFILTYLGTIRVGDYVIIGQTEGVVAHIGVFTTRVETIFKEAVAIPNVFILTNTITNLSRFPGHDGFVLQAVTTIGYTVPWRQMHAVLIAAAERTPGLKRTPVPYVQQRSLSDFYVEYHLCCHLEHPVERIPVLSQLYCEIQDLCNEQGIQILSPHYMQEPAQPAIVPRDTWLQFAARDAAERVPRASDVSLPG